MNTKETEHFISLLDDYLDGKLEGDTLAQIKHALENDMTLKETLEAHVRARANIRIAGESDLKAKFVKSFDTIPDQKKQSNWKALLAILLTIGLAALAYYLYQSDGSNKQELPQKIEVNSAKPVLLAQVEDPNYDLLRSDKASASLETWQMAVQSFVSKDYEKTLETLMRLENDLQFVEDHQGKYTLMRGVSNLKLERFVEAKTFLTTINSDNPYFDQAEWYLALNSFYFGKLNDAKTQFESIANRKTHYKSEASQVYLNQLSN